MTTTILDTDPMNEEDSAPPWQAWRDHQLGVWAVDVPASSYRGAMDAAAIRYDGDDREEPCDE